MVLEINCHDMFIIMRGHYRQNAFLNSIPVNLNSVLKMAIVQQPNLNMRNKIYDSRTEFGATQQNLQQNRIYSNTKAIFQTSYSAVSNSVLLF
jgi:hypothetical protein